MQVTQEKNKRCGVEIVQLRGACRRGLEDAQDKQGRSAVGAWCTMLRTDARCENEEAQCGGACGRGQWRCVEEGLYERSS